MYEVVFFGLWPYYDITFSSCHLHSYIVSAVNQDAQAQIVLYAAFDLNSVYIPESERTQLFTFACGVLIVI